MARYAWKTTGADGTDRLRFCMRLHRATGRTRAKLPSMQIDAAVPAHVPVAERAPVLDSGQLCTRRRVVTKAAGEVRAQLARLGEHVVLAAVLRGDASGDAVVV